MATFTYDLGQNWKLEQTVVEVKGGRGVSETMVFYNKDGASIALPNESCERLRAIFKKITQ